MRKQLVIFLLLCLHGLARGQTEGYNCYYWFDSQNGKVLTAPMLQGLFDIDVSTFDDGIHSFHCLTIDNKGIASPPVVRFFMKPPKADSVIQGYYWFDEETEVREATVSNGAFEVDASSLSDGFHRFHYRALQVNGGMSMISTSYFLKTAQVNPDDELTCICTVDDQLRHIEKLSQQGGVIHWNLNMQDLTDGVHKIQLQAMTPSGALSSSYTSYFMRVTSYEDLSEMNCFYAIDGNSFNSRSKVVSQNGSFHFDLDLSELEEGLHSITFLLNNDRGTSTTAQTRFFVKVPLGGNGINQYQYWLNDDEINAAITITLQEKVNPLQLLSLLPVESRPLRSSQFHFDISSGKPMIYAKNTIHLRFHDIAMRFSDVAKEYADYSQSREVEYMGELQATQAFPTIEENDIRWYTLQSAPGDTVAFKLSQPATIQLFAPSGEEIFKTSESASVKWSGTHVWEDGTYYLAVHDVTGSKEDMTLDYIHMDKYDVVNWDVHRVGNGGCSTITFKGNGFRDLYAVDLVVAPGDTIHSVYVSHDSDAETAVAFDFTDATLGEYNAVFHFTEEDKFVANIVTVEEAFDIELATDVSFPSSFLRGTSTTYTIKITNKGNMTAYNVPLSIKISNSSNNDISHIALDGLGLKKLFDYIENFDSWTTSEIESFKQQCAAIGEDHYFVKLKAADENGDSIFIRTGLFGLSVPPNTTKTISLTLTSSENVEVWIAAANKVSPLTSETFAEQTSNRVRHRIGAEDINKWFCCHYEQITCIGNIVADIADIASLFTGPEGAILMSAISCASNIISQITTVAGTAFCNEDFIEKTLKERIKEIYNNISIVGTVVSCLSHAALKSKQFMEWFEKILSNGSLAFDVHSSLGFECFDAFLNKKPNCPPNPPGGGPSTPRPPVDPNDIFGYLSEAGSKFIADSVARVNYTIEFENDTAFAEASAHTIVIKDTLDSQYFDLKSFMPTGIKLGEHETFLDERQDVKSENGVTSFVKTIDLRPAINAIAQVDGTYDHTKGIAQWTFQSLDPMSMEPTNDLMQGILPVNYDGISGIGEVIFEIGVKPNKADGTEVDNRACIVFDYENPIQTPTWTNIVDAVPPISTIGELEIMNDTIIRVNVNGSDARSGVWKYELYVQHGQNAPWWKEGETDRNSFDFRFYDDIDYGFCVLATDSAGNVEKKELQRERKFNSNDEEFEDAIEGLPESTVDNKEEYDLSGRKAGRKAKGVIIRNRRKTLSK